MTGGYVESDDMEKLLKTPTAAMAVACISCQINHWFSAGPDMSVLSMRGGSNMKALMRGKTGQQAALLLCESDPRVEEIRERYGAEVFDV